MTIKKLTAVFIFVFVFTLLLSLPCSAEQGEERALTLMVYMCGSDLESDYGCASDDMQEMISSRLDAALVNLIVLTGGAKAPGWTEPACSRLDELGNFEPVAIDGIGKNMGEAGTLSTFLSESAARFPAREYALILWDHGGGPLEGLCYDEPNDPDRLSLSELASALRDSPFGEERKLAWIGFDACLMGSVETASVCAPYARYMIASEETEPAQGWDYRFLRELGTRASAADDARAIVDASVDLEAEELIYTLACVDLERITEVKAALDGLYTSLDAQLTPESFSRQSNSRRAARSFGSATLYADYDLADLFHLSQQLEGFVPDEAAALQASLCAAVFYNRSNRDDALGLSLYAPFRNRRDYLGSWCRICRELRLSEAYLNYMDNYARIWLGGKLVDWSGLTYYALPTTGASQAVELRMTEEQSAHLSAAKVLILQETGENDGYYKIFESSELEQTGNTLHFNYDYSALYAVGENGEILTNALPIETREGYYYLPALFENSYFYKRKADYDSMSAYLRYQQSADADTLVLADIIERAPENQLNLGRQGEHGLENWPYVRYDIAVPLHPTRDGEGGLLPFPDWEEATAQLRNRSIVTPDNQRIRYTDIQNMYDADTLASGDYHYFGEIPAREAARLRFIKRQFSGFCLYAQFVLTDSQGNQIASELIPLDNPNRVDGMDLSRELYAEDGLTADIERIELINADYNPGLYIYLKVENNTPQDLRFELSRLSINGMYLALYGMDSIRAYPHSVTRSYLYVSSTGLSLLHADRITELGFVPCFVDLNDGNRRTCSGQEQTIRTDLDMRGLADQRGLFDSALSETDRIIVFRLLSLTEKENGDLEGELRLLNRKDKTERIVFISATGRHPGVGINGTFMDDCLDIPAMIELPPYTDMRTRFSIHRSPYTQRPFSSGDLFDDRGIGELSAISFYFFRASSLTDTDWFSHKSNAALCAELKLAETLPLRPITHGPQAGGVPLLQTPTLGLELVGLTRENGKIRLYLDATGTIREREELSAIGILSAYLDDTKTETRWDFTLSKQGKVMLPFAVLSQYQTTQQHERGVLDLRVPGKEGLPDFELIELDFICGVDGKDVFLTPAYILPWSELDEGETMFLAEKFCVEPSEPEK